MSASRQIQMVLLASLLWSSMSLSRFSANATTPKTNESVTVKIPDNLIAGQIRDMASKTPQIRNSFYNFDEIWKDPTNRQQKLFDYCNTTQKEVPPRDCFKFLQMWVMDQKDTISMKMVNSDFAQHRQYSRDMKELDNINNEVNNILKKS